MYLKLSESEKGSKYTEVLICSLIKNKNKNNESEIKEILNNIKSNLQDTIHICNREIGGAERNLNDYKEQVQRINNGIKEYEVVLKHFKNQKNFCENLIKKYKI